MPNANHRGTLALLLLIVAAVPRFWALGELGFYGDEETTSFPARALAEGGLPRMPTGMLYFRGILITLLNGLSAALFGVDAELSYRIPTALLGTLTIPLLFLVARPAWGTTVAFLAAWTLGLSEWHIAMSREARMYAPFVMVFALGGIQLYRYARSPSGGRLRAAIGLLVLATGFHTLARTGFAMLFIPPTTTAPKEGKADGRLWKLIPLALVVLTATQFISRCFILAPYRGWTVEAEHLGRTNPFCSPMELVQLFAPLAVVLLVMRVVERKLGAERLVGWVRLAAVWGGGLGFLAAILGGQLYFALLMLLAWIAVAPQAPLAIVRRRPWALAAIALVAAGHLGLAVARHLDSGLVSAVEAGIKQTISIPFAYLLYFHELAGPLGLLFVVVALTIGLRSDWDAPETRFAILAAWLPLVVAGLFSSWSGRYLAGALPFICLVTAQAFHGAGRWIAGRIGGGGSGPAWLPGAVGALLVALTPLGIGVLPSWKAATVDYGDPLSQLIYAHPTYPDHQSVGRWLAERRCDGDVVIAEDSLQQRWYAGPVDIWLRNPDTHTEWIYRAEDGTLRDIYVDSELPSEGSFFASVARNDVNVWLVTSAEAFDHWDQGVDGRRLEWLMSILENDAPLFSGRDLPSADAAHGRSRVYCVNCPDGELRTCSP